MFTELATHPKGFTGPSPQLRSSFWLWLTGQTKTPFQFYLNFNKIFLTTLRNLHLQGCKEFAFLAWSASLSLLRMLRCPEHAALLDRSHSATCSTEKSHTIIGPTIIGPTDRRVTWIVFARCVSCDSFIGTLLCLTAPNTQLSVVFCQCLLLDWSVGVSAKSLVIVIPGSI